MNIIDIILLPFVFMYRGLVTIFLIPYYIIIGIIKLFSKNSKKTSIPEMKKGEKVKVIKAKKSAYDEPVKEVITPNPNEKNIKSKKRQKEFEKMVAKARKEEIRKIEEQEKIRLENEKRAKEKIAIESIRQKREDAIEAAKARREELLKSKGEPVSLSDKINSFFKKLTYNKNEELELEAKKKVLQEQFKTDNKKSAGRLTNALTFKYLARNPKGELEKGTIEALSRVDVHSFLLAEGYDVYDITAAKPSPNIITFKLKKTRLIFYLSQLSAYLKAGMALAEAVKILDDQTKNINEKKIWRAIYYDLSMGDVLSVAMEKRKDTFPKLLINMIKMAEMTGNLIETLDDMVDYYTETESTKRQVQTALTYPAVILIFATAVVIYILLVTIPSFAEIYKDMGADLPKITTMIINLSNFLKEYILYISIGIVLFCLVFIYMYRSIKSFRKHIQEFTMHLPVVGKVIIYSEVTIFSKTFANLINHNIFITDSMDVLGRITSNEVYKKLINDTARNLNKGELISKAFKNQWAFPVIAYQMLLTGEKTGRIGTMMEKVAEYYQEQHRNLVNQMKSLIEPIVIIFLAVVVGGILIAVIVPMYGMYTGLQS